MKHRPRVKQTRLAAVPGLAAGAVRRVVERAWEIYGGPDGAVVEVAFLSEEQHCRVHDQFLGDPSATDVMAFPYGDAQAFGEILVNSDMARRQAAARRVPVRQEALLYVAHGALHLLGFRDDDAAARDNMRAAERRVLAD